MRPLSRQAAGASARPGGSPTGAVLAALLLFLSGAGSLTLEVAWSRCLKLVFGSTTLAISTVLVAYMLGLGLGGLLGGRLASRFKNGVAAYGIFELIVGAYALLVPSFVGLYPTLDGALLGGLPLWSATLGRFFLALLVLLAPTLLMGATLPVLVDALAANLPGCGRNVGLLYGANTAGAVVGALVTTFVLFPWLGLYGSNTAGAALDLAAGALALRLAAPRMRRRQTERAPSRAAAAPAVATGDRPALPRWNVALVCYGVVGFTALAYEVAWTRALAMVTGSSVYAFAAMLAAFLAGIALGSLLARRSVDRLLRPLPVYGAGLAALGLSACSTTWLLRPAPDLLLGLHRLLGPGWSGAMVASGLLVSLALLAAPTLVLGALFPLVVAALAGRGRLTSAVVGDVYFVNTIGAALGAFAAGFVLIPRLGLAATVNAMIALDLIAAGAVLLWQREWRGRRRWGAAGGAALAGFLTLALPSGLDPRTLTRGVFYAPWRHSDYGVHTTPLRDVPQEELLFYRDGLSATISVHRIPGNLVFKSNGKPDASLGDMDTQILAGQAPALFGGRDARTALVIGLASGASAGSLALHPIERIDVVEIEPAVAPAARFFDDYNNRPLARPSVRLIFDDGRSFLARTREQYDLIASEPSNPFITGVSNLFTREFFHAARRALKPGGRLCQWVQLYAMDDAGLRSILAALHAEFPYVYGLLYAADHQDLILIAGGAPLTAADLPRWESLPRAVREDLQRILIFSTADLWSLVRLLPEDVARLASEAPTVNSDRSMYIELHAPWLVSRIEAASLRLPASPGLGAADILERGGGKLPAEALGQLALADLIQRSAPQSAARLAALARQRGPSAAGLAAEAMLILSSERPDAGRALALLDEAVALRPEAFEPRFLRASLRLELGQREGLGDALDDVDAALRALPGDWRALHLRLQLLNQLDRPAEAERDARVLLATPLAPLFRPLWLDAAYAAAGVGRYEEAERRLLFFLESTPNRPEDWRTLAVWRRLAGRRQAADEADVNAQLALRNDLLLAHRNARRELVFGSPARARRLLEDLLERDPAYAPAREDLRRLP